MVEHVEETEDYHRGHLLRRRATPLGGDLLYYPGGISEKELLIPYGSRCFGSRVGQLQGNHFATIVEGAERLGEMGWRKKNKGQPREASPCLEPPPSVEGGCECSSESTDTPSGPPSSSPCLHETLRALRERWCGPPPGPRQGQAHPPRAGVLRVPEPRGCPYGLVQGHSAAVRAGIDSVPEHKTG